MKLATYLYDGARSYGVVVDGGICDVPTAWPDGPASLLEAIPAGGAMERIETIAASCQAPLPIERVELLAPLPNPPKVLALAGNYVKHIVESNLAKGLSADPPADTTPRPFLMPATVIAAPGSTIAWPVFSREIDYEIELAVVIGSTCKCVTPDEAADRIFGYTIANDVSARSTSFAASRSKRPWDEFYDWLNGKWADGFCPIGPYLVTADGIGDPRNLELELTVNGQTRQKDTTANMIFDVYQIVSFLSHIMTLTPGDVIATGTPSGVGMATGDYLQAGDVITCRIENIGEMTNTLGPRPDEFYQPCDRAGGGD